MSEELRKKIAAQQAEIEKLTEENEDLYRRVVYLAGENKRLVFENNKARGNIGGVKFKK